MKRSIISMRPVALAAHLARIPLFQLILWCFAALLVPRGSAQEGISGQLGVANYEDVANFSELARKEASTPPSVQPRKAKPFFRVPKRIHNLPVSRNGISSAKPVSKTPQNSPLSAQSSPSSAAGPGAGGPSVPSPAPSASFLALADDGRKYLPSTQGAVGVSNLMVTLNSQVSIQDRAGNALNTMTLDGWWGGSFGCSNVSDPRVLFDTYRQRWIFAAVGDRDTPLGLLVAVSRPVIQPGIGIAIFIRSRIPRVRFSPTAP